MLSSVLSTQGDPTGSWQPLQNEVFALDLHSTAKQPRISRLAHHHSAPEFVSAQPESSCPLSPEAVLSSPSLSRDARDFSRENLARFDLAEVSEQRGEQLIAASHETLRVREKLVVGETIETVERRRLVEHASTLHPDFRSSVFASG